MREVTGGEAKDDRASERSHTLRKDERQHHHKASGEYDAMGEAAMVWTVIDDPIQVRELGGNRGRRAYRYRLRRCVSGERGSSYSYSCRADYVRAA